MTAAEGDTSNRGGQRTEDAGATIKEKGERKRASYFSAAGRNTARQGHDEERENIFEPRGSGGTK